MSKLVSMSVKYHNTEMNELKTLPEVNNEVIHTFLGSPPL